MAFPKQGSMDTPPILNEVEKVYNAIKRHQRMIATGVLVTFLSVAAASSIVSAHGNGSAHPIDVGGNDNGEDNNSVTGPIPHETPIPKPTMVVLPTATETPAPTLTPVDFETPTEVSIETEKNFDWSVIKGPIKSSVGKDTSLDYFNKDFKDMKIYRNPNKDQAYPILDPKQIPIIKGNDGLYIDQDDAFNRNLFAQGCDLIVAERNKVGFFSFLEEVGDVNYAVTSGQVNPGAPLNIKWPDKDKTGQVYGFPDDWLIDMSLSVWDPTLMPPTHFIIIGGGKDVLVSSNDNLTPEQWSALVYEAKAKSDISRLYDGKLKNYANIRIFESQQEVDAYIAYALANPSHPNK